jgi:hypothetical protein
MNTSNVGRGDAVAGLQSLAIQVAGIAHPANFRPAPERPVPALHASFIAQSTTRHAPDGYTSRPVRQSRKWFTAVMRHGAGRVSAISFRMNTRSLWHGQQGPDDLRPLR